MIKILRIEVYCDREFQSFAPEANTKLYIKNHESHHIADVSLLHIPGYKIIHQGSRCTRHGGLVMYLHEQYTYNLRNMYTRSDIWEGLFIDVSDHNLHRPITIGNIYRPPHNNNNNANIEIFIEEMSLIINTLQKENKYATIVSDFNINLLQINEREKM